MLQDLLDRIRELTGKMRANIEHRGELAGVLEHIGGEVDALKTHVEGLAHEATGDTGAAVVALGERLDSLTAAFTALGAAVTARMDEVEKNEEIRLRVYSTLAARVATLEKTPVPAPQLQAPYAPTPGVVITGDEQHGE